MVEFIIYYDDLIDMMQLELKKKLEDAGFDISNEIIRYYDVYNNTITYRQHKHESII